jgi:mannose-1-phosphate guanylyltransferase
MIDTSSCWGRWDIRRIHGQRGRHDPSERRGGTSAIVLCSGYGETTAALTQRLVGSSVPTPYISYDGRPSALEDTVARLERHVPHRRMRIVTDRRHAAYVARQLATRDVREVNQRRHVGSAIGVLVALLHALVEDPDALVIVTPAHHVIDDAVMFDEALRAALACAERRDSLILVGANPSVVAATDAWILPHGGSTHRWAAAPVARYVHAPARHQRAGLRARGAVVATGIVVAKGSVLLDLYQRLTPRVLRLFLYALDMNPATSSAFTDEAMDGLSSLDLSSDMLPLAHDLSCIALPREAGWSQLDDEARVLEWLAKRRSGDVLRRSAARAYRRVSETSLVARSRTHGPRRGAA